MQRGVADILRSLSPMARRDDESAEDPRVTAERYRLLVNMIPQHVWTTDRSGRFTFASQRLYDYSGATVEALATNGWLELVHPEDRERANADWRVALATGKPSSTEFRLRSKDGTYRWFLAQARPLRNDQGEIVQWFGTTTDIHEKKTLEAEREEFLAREHAARTEAEARAREERALREAVAIVVVARSAQEAIDAAARSAFEAANANGMHATYIDHERDEVVPVVSAGDAPEIGNVPYDASLTRRAIAIGAPVRLDRIAESPERAFVESVPAYYREWSLLVIPLIGLEPIGALFLSRKPGPNSRFTDEDVERVRTFSGLVSLAISRVRLLEKAERRRREVERLSESRTRLIRGLSHDLKNPLGAADGFAALLEEGSGGSLTGQQRTSVERIRRSIRTSLKLIEDLLDFARAEAGKLQLERKSVDIAALTSDVTEDFRAQITGKGLSLSIDASEAAWTETDPARVRQIVANLVSNAAKYAKQGSIVVAIRSRSKGGPRHGEWIAVDVRDTGPGVPADKQEIIFQEFTRLDPDAPHGAGVGLAISRQLARALGGNITLASEPGRGATFTLWLPRTT